MRLKPQAAYEAKIAEAEDVKRQWREAQENANILMRAGGDSEKACRQADSLKRRWFRLHGELAGYRNRAAKATQSKPIRRGRRSMSTADVDPRTAAGNRDRETVDNARIGGVVFTRKQPARRMFDQKGDHTIRREKAIEAFERDYHGAARETGLKSVSLEMKVDISHGSGRDYRGAPCSKKMAALHQRIGSVNFGLLVDRIINDLTFAWLADQSGQSRRDLGRDFARSLDQAADILGVRERDEAA